MKPDLSCRLSACAVAALLVTACSRAPSQGPKSVTSEAAGERSMRSMSDTLAGAKAFSFETSEMIQFIAASGEKRVLRFTRKVTVRRPNALFFELHGKGDTALDVAAYYDGRTVSLRSGTDKVWAQSHVPGTLDEMLDDVARRFGLPVPIADVVYSSPYDAFIGPTSRGGLVGQETIDGVPCVKFDYDDPIVEVRIWVPASGSPLPRREEIVYKKVPGRKSEIDFTNWNLDAQADHAMFAFQPPGDYRRVEFRDFVARLAPGAVPSGGEAASLVAPGAKQAGEPGAR